jgi:UDP-N-acetylmuramoyl-L-alanyl-D-glutamate--2,6-diaminopimelate ligase
MKLFDLIKNIDTEEINIKDNLEICGMTADSREVKNNYIFICHSGTKTDGHKYIKDALENGAVLLVMRYKPENFDGSMPYILVKSTRETEAKLWARWHNNPAEDIKIIGITGTNGKTSVSYMIKEILDEAGYKTALFGTIKSIIDGAEHESELTTADPEEMARLFAAARDAGVEYAVMEVSSHALELEKTAGLGEFEVGIFTNLTQDHLDFHGDMLNYRKAKAKLFKRAKTGILNADDEASWYMLNGGAKNYFYGKAKHADFYADNIKYLGAEGIEYDFCVGGPSFDDIERSFKIKSPSAGEFYVYNSMAAAACGIILGIDGKIIAGALGKVKIKGRMERLDIDAPYYIFIDYAHTPDALERAIKAVRGFSGDGRIISVFGCGGDRDKSKRPEMGRIAAANSDFCVITSDNSRSEEPGDIIKDIIAGIDIKSAYETVVDRRKAIELAINMAGSGDIILLAGKGHEEYIDEKGGVRRFSEREVVAEILGKKNIFI